MKEKFEGNMALVDVEEKPAVKTHTCPSSGEKFLGKCPVLTCPANMTGFHNKEPGCAYMEVRGVVDKYVLAYAFKMSVEDCVGKIERGKMRMRAASMLYETIETLELKEVSVIGLPRCPNCAIRHNGACLNTEKCKRRVKLGRKLLKMFPFNNKELKLTQETIMDLGTLMPKVKEMHNMTAQRLSTPVSELLMLPPKAMRQLEFLTSSLREVSSNVTTKET